MPEIALHALFWIMFLTVAMICFIRAAQLGKGSLDQEGRISDPRKYLKVMFWGALGLGFAAAVFLDLLFPFNPLSSDLDRPPTR